MNSPGHSPDQKHLNRFFQFFIPIIFFLLCTFCGPTAWSATVTWNVDADGQWHEGSNWSTGLPPASGDDVVIDRAAGVYTITVSTGIQYANTITCTENLTITGGSLTVASTVQVGGLFALEGGALIDAVVQSNLGCNGTSGYLDGVVMDGDMTLGEVSTTFVNILNGLTLNGTAYVGWGIYSGRLSFSGGQTLGGTGEVVFSDNGLNTLYLSSGVLTIGPDILVHGERGSINCSGFVNQGTISSDVADGLITLYGTDWLNEGIIETVNGGGLNLEGSVTTAGLGDWRGTGGQVELKTPGPDQWVALVTRR